MSEGCSGCKAGKYAGSHAGKLGVCGACSAAADAGGDCACLGKSRVQVRAKVLYGSGAAIANLRAKEKTANRPNL